ncbi:MAG: efflux RND transporter permease subunit, partial [Candidatus Aminicenantes bacterium]
GMLVDNAVVVSENIYRHRRTIPDTNQATMTGVNEVALAITAGTSTTAIVFLPNILNQQGEISLQIKHVAVAFCIALACSLILAQTVVPFLASKIKSSPNDRKYTVIDRLISRYKRVLNWLLLHRKTSSALILLVLFSVAIPVSIVKKDMFPQMENRELGLYYNINDSYTVDRVEAAVDKVEEFLFANLEQFKIESVYTYYTGDYALSTILLLRGAVKDKERIKNEIRDGLPKLSIGSPAFESRGYGGGGDTISIQLTGPSTEQLIELSHEVAWILGKIPGFKDVRSGAAAGRREVHVIVDRERAKKYDFNPQEIARNISVAMRGVNLRRIQSEDGEILVRVEFQEEDKRNLEQLRELTLFKDASRPVKLAALADFKLAQSPNVIYRENRITSLRVSIDLKDLTLNDARREISRVMENFKFPDGYTWTFGRSFSFEDEAIKMMMINTLLALALIYIVMASLFESLIFPAAIWTSIIFAIIGVWWFFLMTGTTFDMMAWFGVLILIVVVVNNGIVLIDYINQLRSRGIARHEAMVKAGGDRLRPILMTAATTVFSLLPLCITRTQIGGNGPPYFPMARAIVGGLVLSTLVTLIILPTIYILLDDLRSWSRRVIAQVRSS